VTYLWRLFLAYFRLNENAVCEMSAGQGKYDDFHDWPDSVVGQPWHFHTHTCKRCGKKFHI
jgi:hypothetical protein